MPFSKLGRGLDLGAEPPRIKIGWVTPPPGIFFGHVSVDALLCMLKCEINPLSPNSDQHQFSPDNIHVLPREMIMRVNIMITKEKILWSVNKLS